MKNYKNVFEFSQEETISEEFILALNTFDKKIPGAYDTFTGGYIHRVDKIHLLKIFQAIE